MNTDWCTLWPDRFQDIDFSHCCKAHDDEYLRICKLSFLKRLIARRRADYNLMK
jgi:hypothetical protein